MTLSIINMLCLYGLRNITLHPPVGNYLFFSAIWDANKGVRIRKLSDHSGIVNSCSVARVRTFSLFLSLYLSLSFSLSHCLSLTLSFSLTLTLSLSLSLSFPFFSHSHSLFTSLFHSLSPFLLFVSFYFSFSYCVEN